MTTRHSIYHLADAGATVCNVFTTTAGQAEAYYALEKHRDASDTHALQLAELEALFAGLSGVRPAHYQYPVKVEALLSRS